MEGAMETKTKAVRMTTVNLITEDDAKDLEGLDRKRRLDEEAKRRALALISRAQEAGFDGFSALARAFADGRWPREDRKTGT